MSQSAATCAGLARSRCSVSDRRAPQTVGGVQWEDIEPRTTRSARRPSAPHSRML